MRHSYSLSAAPGEQAHLRSLEPGTRGACPAEQLWVWSPLAPPQPRPPDLVPALSWSPNETYALKFARNLKGQLFSCFQNLLILSGQEKAANRLLLLFL